MDANQFLLDLKRDPDYAGQIAHVHTQPGRPAQWAPVPENILPPVKQFLSALNISRLYKHQAQAIEAMLDGDDALITTGTASGKSLCYQVPMLQRLLQNPKATALLLFPAKALARDQAKSWNHGIEALSSSDSESLRAMPFDADAGAGDRRLARDSGRVLITNPEMLHMNMLPDTADGSASCVA